MSQPAVALLSSQDVLAALVDDPTEGRLSDLPSPYITVLDTLPWDLDHVAIIAVTVTDGVLLLPVTHVTTGEGWEHLDLDAAQCLPTPTDWAQRTTAFRRARRGLLKTLTAAALAAEEASPHG